VRLLYTLRARLFALVVLVTAPSIGIALYGAFDQRNKGIEHLHSQVEQLSRLTASNDRQVVDRLRRLLQTVSTWPSVRNQDAEACNRAATAAVGEYAPNVSLFVADTAGAVFCRSQQGDPPVTVANEPAFQRAIQTRQFTIGNVRPGQHNTPPVVDISYPVVNAAGLSGVAVVSLSIESLTMFTDDANLPPGAATVLLRRDGTVLLHAVRTSGEQNVILADDGRLRRLAQSTSRTTVLRDVDGVTRVYAGTALGRPTRPAADLLVAVGFPTELAVAEADSDLRRDLSILTVACAVALCFAWLATERAVVHPVRAVLAAAGRLRLGDMRARTGLPHRRGEVGELAYAFDQMAETLEHQAQQRQADHATLRSLSLQLVQTQEAERRRVARELHDQIGQMLTGMHLTLSMSERRPPDEIPEAIAKAQTILNDLITAVRELSLDLRPAVLDEMGLVPALVHHCRRYTEQTGVDVAFSHQQVEGRYPEPIETAIFRIIQEALTNVARHSGVATVTVRLWAEERDLLAEVEDAGRGFAVEATLGARHTAGLSGMRERAMLLGGEVRIVAAPGQGTCIQARIPLDVSAERIGMPE
jgi:signal transduction histidine kinase